jgi:CDP-glucose 4,6-dehydratase
VLSPKVLDLHRRRRHHLGSEPLAHLARDGQLMAYEHDGFWQPMDTLRDKMHLENCGKRQGAVEALGDPAFWRGKRVLVTGHTGFKGSWLSLWLHAAGRRGHGYALAPPTNRACSTRPASPSSCVAHRRHPRRRGAARPRQAGRRSSSTWPRSRWCASYAIRSRPMPPTSWARCTCSKRCAPRPACKAVVCVTSDKCYENREWASGAIAKRPDGRHDPYSSSKACAELVTAAYRASFFARARAVALASARAGNVIGGGDWADDRLSPRFLPCLRQGPAGAVRNPHATRPWQHVLEPLSRLPAAGRAPAALRRRLQLRPARHRRAPGRMDHRAPVPKLGRRRRWELEAAPQPHEAHYLKLDCSKARSRLQWQPRWHLGHTIDMIVDWHQAHAAGADMRALTLAQIHTYQNTAPLERTKAANHE